MCVCVWRVRVHLQLDNVFNEAPRASLSRVPDDLHEIRPRRSVLIGLQPAVARKGDKKEHDTVSFSIPQ